MDAIRAEGLTKRFGQTVALCDLDLAVSPGEVFGFLGPNGAGKSTTIRLLLGLIRPTAGKAWLFGDDIGDVERAHTHVAYVPADVALWPSLTGAECLELLARLGTEPDLDYRASLVNRFVRPSALIASTVPLCRHRGCDPGRHRRAISSCLARWRKGVC